MTDRDLPGRQQDEDETPPAVPTWSRRRLLQATSAATAAGVTAQSVTAQSDSESTATGTPPIATEPRLGEISASIIRRPRGPSLRPGTLQKSVLLHRVSDCP